MTSQVQKEVCQFKLKKIFLIVLYLLANNLLMFEKIFVNIKTANIWAFSTEHHCDSLETT